MKKILLLILATMTIGSDFAQKSRHQKIDDFTR